MGRRYCRAHCGARVLSFLDELKKEAEEIKAKQSRDNDSTQRKRHEVIRTIRSRMQSLHRYLKEACEQLSVVDPDIHMTYELRNYGRLGPLRQGGYKMTVDDGRPVDKFTVSYVCSRAEQLKIQIEGKDAVDKQKEYMWSKVTADGDGVFFVDAYVPITFEFESDYENAKINLRIRNRDSLGSDRVTFEPHRINDELMEEMAKMIVRKDNRFQELAGNMVSEETRMRLRHQLAQAQYTRQVEATSSRTPERPKKKGGLLRSLFKN